MTKLEKDIERKLVDMVKRHGGLCLKWVCPGWSGVPDRIVLLPKGLIFFVETKRPKGGRLSALQRKWRDWLSERGFRYEVVWSDKDVAALEEYIIGYHLGGKHE